jgi:hypothetical protein
MGEKMKGSHMFPFLAIHAKGEENIKPKAKGPHHHPIFLKSFQIDNLMCFQEGEY